MDTASEKLFGLLVQALQLAAADASLQISSLPPFVHITDEIALTYGHSYRLTKEYLEPEGFLDADLVRDLDRLYGLFDHMADDETLWTLDELKQSPRWEETRTLAKFILKGLGMESAPPDLSGTTYIPSKKRQE